MKNALTILLLLVFAFNVGGYFGIVKLQQRQLRREIKAKIKQGIAEDELTLISIAPDEENQLRWKEKGREFIYKGEMYDIVHTKSLENGTKVYHALPDEKEHRLIAEFYKKLKKNNKQKNQPTTNSFKFAKIVVRLPISPFNQENWIFKSAAHNFAHYQNLYHSISLDILSPPPKTV